MCVNTEFSSDRHARTRTLVGEDGMRKLHASSVLIVGLGGVGGCVFEMLARAGIGKLTVVDGDVFETSNLNRQILSSVRDIGTRKTQVAVRRAKEIAPDCTVVEKSIRYTADTAQAILCEPFTYVADCIDSVADKTDLIVRCNRLGIPILSAMGAGNRLQPHFAVSDIFATTHDGLARVMRKKLRSAGVTRLKTVCDATPSSVTAKDLPGTVSYAPNLMGCLMAQEIINDIVCNERNVQK